MNIFEKTTPESCGVSSKHIIEFIEALCMCPENQETHSFVLIRHGKLLCEGYFAPYNKDTEHMLYSVSKSFTSTAIGFLVEDGKVNIEDFIYKYFPELINEHINKENLKIKIKDLLSMSFGQQGAAVHEVLKRDDLPDVMLYDFFYRTKNIKCGEKFRYDAFGTYMLAAIVRKLTGMNVVEYLMPKLFEPLDIPMPFYVKDSIGNNIGYTGMRLKALDLAKVGLVYLNNGKWNGTQIVPENWIKLATQKHISTEECGTGKDWQEGYCYQLWKGRYNTTRLCGAHGQMCVIMPDYDAIFVVNSGYDNDKLSYILDSFYEKIMLKMQNEPLAEDIENFDKLEKVIKNLKITCNFSEMSPLAHIISGKSFELSENDKYNAVKFIFDEDKVNVTLVSDETNFEFTAGFSKAINERVSGTYVTSLKNEGDLNITASAMWKTKKELEITLRFIGTPAIIKVVADFSSESGIKIVPIRCKL